MMESAMHGRFNDIDTNLAVLAVKLTNFLEKIEMLEKKIDHNDIAVNESIKELKQEIKEIKLEMQKLKDDTSDNTKLRKNLTKAGWMIFAAFVGIISFIYRSGLTI